jgi:prophage DNA circulation protein
MATIRDLAEVEPWRLRLLPAHFDGIFFHVEAGSRENGRRIVTHEFPKKELPYSEDMGRRAIEFTVRGYCIQFVSDVNELYQRDYTIPRDLLQERLDRGGAGTLQLPLLQPMEVVCTRYRLSEEQRVGGYCVFDMSFVEFGAPPFQPVGNSYDNLIQQSLNLRQETLTSLA